MWTPHIIFTRSVTVQFAEWAVVDRLKYMQIVTERKQCCSHVGMAQINYENVDLPPAVNRDPERSIDLGIARDDVLALIATSASIETRAIASPVAGFITLRCVEPASVKCAPSMKCATVAVVIGCSEIQMNACKLRARVMLLHREPSASSRSCPLNFPAECDERRNTFHCGNAATRAVFGEFFRAPHE